MTTNRRAFFYGWKWLLAAALLYEGSKLYAQHNYTQPPAPTPVTTSYVTPPQLPACEDTTEEYCDELGILLPPTRASNTVPPDTVPAKTRTQILIESNPDND